MSAFPPLRTGSVAQYPLDRAVRFRTQSVRFLDGSRQSFRLVGTGLRRWKIQLDLLDEQELAAVAAFVEQQGTAVFQFSDPVNGDSVPRCIIAGPGYRSELAGEMSANATVEIEEVA